MPSFEQDQAKAVALELRRLADAGFDADHLRAIAEYLETGTMVPVPEPIPAPAPNRVLYGATYSNPTLPAVHNYKVQAVPIFGWGTTEYNFDARVAEIQSAEYRVLTACNAPPQFRGPATDQWGGLNDRVLAQYHQAYADWVGAAVARNKALGRTFTHAQLWNEGKGYWNAAENRWNYEECTDLQNHLYDAIKAADSNIQCGGPYPALSKDLPGTGSNPAKLGSLNGPWGDADQRDFDWLEYYFKNGKFDFVCVDANLGCRPWFVDANGQAALHDPPGGVAAADFFVTVAWWIRSKVGPDKPIWWSEIYPYVGGRALWTEVYASLQAVPGEHVLMWWAESPYPPPPIV